MGPPEGMRGRRPTERPIGSELFRPGLPSECTSARKPVRNLLRRTAYAFPWLLTRARQSRWQCNRSRDKSLSDQKRKEMNVSLRFGTFFGSLQKVHRAELVSMIIDSEGPRLILVWQTRLACGNDVDYLDKTVITESGHE